MRKKYEKYIAAGLTIFLVIAASLVLFFLLYKISVIRTYLRSIFRILEPFVFGLLIAYLLAPLYNRIVANLSAVLGKKLKEKPSHMISVAVALTVSILLTLLVVIGFISLVVPQFINSIIGIVNALPTYANRISAWLSQVLANYPDVEESANEILQSVSTSLMNWVNSKLTPDVEKMLESIGDLSALLSGVWGGLQLVVRLVKDFILGVFISAYLLVWKRHLIAQAKKICYGIFKHKHANFLLSECRYVQEVFGGFIRGKLLDSLIIGILCFIGCSILRMPYAIVISVIIGLTNIIPFFGPFIGAVPSAFLILLVSPIKCLYFVIFILVLQQFDGNVLGPRILGNSTGLSPFWVLFSIIIFGGLFGFVGMVIGVPLFAVIYSLVDDYLNSRLRKRSLPTDTMEYELLEEIGEKDKAFVRQKDPTIK